ncbi:acyl carrier protein phosphodiesterase [Marinilabilia salmonicolor]|uniref:acyl carrier protein phosphodiesterase n=1 Tax=Marinilabilia salmonicolor TaxID=989 RepID=UPI00029AD928|nr:ACP phosphodiesterase [Marinilabilia salmonicolor]
MNYLAHLYLSNNDPLVMVGNFIGDHVKGRRFLRYPDSVQTGILLHRHIDTFTDAHPVFRESSGYFRDGYRRYAGVVGDIIYDHLLAAKWNNYSDESLKSFVNKSHRILMRHYFTLPPRVKQFLPFLIKSRRLENYQTFEGVERTLRIMSANSSLPDHTDFALEQLEKHYITLTGQFNRFMTDIIASSKVFLENTERPQSFEHTEVS